MLLTGPTYGLTTDAVGALGLLSATTMICAPLAGRLADRAGPDPVNLVSLVGTIASAAVLAAGAGGGPTGLIAVTVGVLLLDVTMQSGMTANLTRIYAALGRVAACPQPWAQWRLHNRQRCYRRAFYAFGSQSASCSIGSVSPVVSRPSSGTRA